MGNVAAFKARVTLESDEYIAGWKKVETATTNSVSGMEKAISNGMKSWSKAMGKAVAGFLGIQLADTLVKSIDDTLKNPIFDNAGANIAYAVGDGFAKTLESIPVAGTIGKWIASGIGSATDAIEMTSDASGKTEERIKQSREEAQRNQRMLEIGSKMVADLEKQRELSAAVGDEQRTRVERAQRLVELEKQLNDQMAKEGATGPQIVAARDKLRAAFEATSAAQDEAIKRQEREKMLAEQAADAEKERARIAEEAAKAQERAQADAEKRAEMRAAAEERHQDSVMDFMEDLQDALDERTMTEEQLFQKKMERMGLDEEEQAQAIALNNRLKAVESRDKLSSLSNVESISTAVGGVKMAGTTSGLDRLAKPAETTAKATQASAEHLRKMAAAAGAV
jgi:hypothetical protein